MKTKYKKLWVKIYSGDSDDVTDMTPVEIDDAEYDGKTVKKGIYRDHESLVRWAYDHADSVDYDT